MPSVIDGEPSQQPQDPNDKGAGSGGGKSPAPRLELPTTLAGVPPARAGGGDDSGAEEPPADATLDAAIEAQRQLLEEFAKVADDLSKVMANLEGSTFVRRLKLLSRRELAIAGGLAATKPAGFGKGGHHLADVAKHVRAVAEAHGREALTLSNIMDDMQAYFDRRQLPAFRSVLEEMKSLDALGGLRALTDDIRKEPGMSLAQAEFWSDVFDRLADDLVPPPPGGPPGPRGPVDGVPPSVPPDIVLETMRILEAEVNLREETRVAEQNRKAVGAEEFAATGRKLGKAQDALADRVVRMVDRLLDEENGASAFAREIQLFEKVEEVMAEAADILRQPDTGKQAIAAETEVIELLLEAQTPPAGPGSPGAPGAPGPGATPGAGSTGSTNALADILRGAGNATQGNSGNRGNGEKDAATGTAGRDLPAEYRDGLDRYFNEVERQRR